MENTSRNFVEKTEDEDARQQLQDLVQDGQQPGDELYDKVRERLDEFRRWTSSHNPSSDPALSPGSPPSSGKSKNQLNMFNRGLATGPRILPEWRGVQRSRLVMLDDKMQILHWAIEILEKWHPRRYTETKRLTFSTRECSRTKRFVNWLLQINGTSIKQQQKILCIGRKRNGLRKVEHGQKRNPQLPRSILG